MPEQPPKRRGRPPGSKNAVKTSPAIAPGLTVLPLHPSHQDNPNYPPTQSFGVAEFVGPEPVRVVLRSNRGKAFGEAPDEHEIDWPPEWRLPQVGESIRVSGVFAGFIEWIDWDLERKIVAVKLR
jgi:hypothetical protein